MRGKKEYIDRTLPLRKSFFAATLAFVMSSGGVVHGQFGAIIDIPPDPDIGDNGSVGSGTQLNLHAGGSIGDEFRAGSANVHSTSLEVNIRGGTAGTDFTANDGSVVNVMAGFVGNAFHANSGSQVNINGGQVGDEFAALNGSLVNMTNGRMGRYSRALGSEVNISGGQVGFDFDALTDSVVNISNGSVGGNFDAGLEDRSSTNVAVNVSGGTIGGNMRAHSGSTVCFTGGILLTFSSFGFEAHYGSLVKVFGGTVDANFDTFEMSDVNIYGDQFMLDDDPVGPGKINVPPGRTLTGILSDGTPFALSDLLQDEIMNDTLTLHSAQLPPIGPPVINVPDDPAPRSIRSGQTLFVGAGGVLDDNFRAGPGSTVNMTGGRVGAGMEVRGATVNISDGNIFSEFIALEGSEVNISGGHVGSFLDAYNSVVEISGGSGFFGFRPRRGSVATISGGMFEGFFFADEGSEVSISGGVFGPSFLPSRGSAITLSGNEFRLDGELIAGLEAIDDTVVVEVTRGRQLDGILADGTPFAFSSNVGDFSEEVSVTLRAAVLPATGPSVIHVPSQPAPAVIRRGQTLTVEPGGDLGDSFRTGRGSIVNVNDGSIGFDFEAVDATVNVTGGSIGSSFTLFGGEANITGGSVAQSFRVLDGGTVNVSGGEVGVAGLFFNSLEAYSGSTVNVSGGVVGPRFLARDGSEVNISGGTVGDRFQALSFVEGQTVVNVSGGEFAGVVFANGAEFNLFGSEFRLDGVAIPGLVLDESFMVTDRDVPLTGILADGTPFSFDLTSTITFATDTFTPSTQLTVTLVDRVSIPGDFNLDGMLDVVDVDALVTQIAGGSNNVSFDLNGDNAVDRDDLTNWLSVAALRNGFQEAYLVGDSNLDGAVNSGDLNNLALNWRQDVALWSGGDFTASGQVNSSDLNALALHWQQAISSASAVRETVPEPSSWLLMVIGLFPIWHRKRRRSYG